jgi:ubiquinone/menaquinone biosynthesis C-methylase UbiE
MKLNIGCGRHVIDGWTNVDIQRSPHAKRDPEILSDVRTIPLPDACADELMAIHLFEHFYLWETPALIGEWKRLLKPGGLLALELPNIVKCCRNIVKDVEAGLDSQPLGMWGLYGDPRAQDPYMTHRWGWSPKTLTAFLAEHGFADIKEEVTQWHGLGRKHRDMRIVAVKA